jgi:hypothetical protein
MKYAKTGLALSTALALVGGIYWASQRDAAPQKIDDSAKLVSSSQAATQPALKPSFQLQTVDQSWQTPALTSTGAKLPAEPDFGKFEESTAARLDNAQAKSNIEALQHPDKFPERLSAQVQGKPIDVERFKTDAAYHDAVLAVSEPSRALASSSDSRAALLRRLSEAGPSVKQGESILLRALAAPAALVAFYAPNGGRFSNGLTHISVAADANGEAEVQFDGISGVISSSEVICASPSCAGTLVYKIQTLQADTQASK